MYDRLFLSLSLANTTVFHLDMYHSAAAVSVRTLEEQNKNKQRGEIPNQFFHPRWDKRIQNLHIGRFAPGSDNWPAANIETGTKNEQHYTSGLWALLHALSVSTAPGRQDPYAIMEGIHSFVANFFRSATLNTAILAVLSVPSCDEALFIIFEVYCRSCFVPYPFAHRVFNDKTEHLTRHESYKVVFPLSAVSTLKRF